MILQNLKTHKYVSCKTLTSRYLEHHDDVSWQTQDLRNVKVKPILRNLNWQIEALRRLMHNNYVFWLITFLRDLKNHNCVFWLWACETRKTMATFSNPALAKPEKVERRCLGGLLAHCQILTWLPALGFYISEFDPVGSFILSFVLPRGARGCGQAPLAGPLETNTLRIKQKLRCFNISASSTRLTRKLPAGLNSGY